MRILQRYISIEVMTAVLFVLVAFLALFGFFDLMGELPEVGRGGYRLQHAFLFVLLGLPGYIYELMPIAALIGTIYALASFASRSEFTIMRASGMSTGMAGLALAKIGLVFVFLTFLFGEFIAPAASEMAQTYKLQARGASISQEFRSGLWAKDVIRRNGVTGEQVGTRFINVREVKPSGQLIGVRLYEFDPTLRLTAIIRADHAVFSGANTWRLTQVTENLFTGNVNDNSANVENRTLASRDLVTEVTPDILSVLFADPDRMSAVDLSAYTRHLAENKQSTARYELAFWKKVVYPFAVLVMMALALPFAYLHFRAGGLSLKIFIGIMIGVAFQLLNSLFSHIGLLNTWPAISTAILPSAMFLLLAIGSLLWVQRH